VSVPIQGPEQWALENRASSQEVAMLLLAINVLIIVVVGAILFWVVDKFVRDGRLGNLLKILIVLLCLGAILVRVLPMFGGDALL
jgi:F0F1-type ATP synthase assembly protein I